MEPENLCYALVQVVHNFGAAAVMGGSVVMVSWLPEAHRQRQIARLVLAGWLTQALSGVGFGAVSLYYYGQLPDIHGVALAALWVKVGCALVGMVALLFSLLSKGHYLTGDAYGNFPRMHCMPPLW
ncbi:MAG: hypothetical protein ACREAQ_01010 [Nitrososphaera sp.]